MVNLRAFLNLLVLGFIYLLAYITPLGITLFIWWICSICKPETAYLITVTELVRRFDKVLNLLLVGELEDDWRGVIDYRANAGDDTAKRMRYIIEVWLKRTPGYCASYRTKRHWSAKPGWNLPF